MTTDRIPNEQRRGLWRSRWAAIGAAVAVSLGGGGFFVANAAPSAPSSVVTIDPVRILDTRTDVGLPGPFVSAVSQKLQVTGAVVPAGATGVLLNATVVNPSANGFLAIRPGDASGAPSTSSLNFNAGDIVPNSVQVGLPTAGANAGKIDITYDAYGTAGPTTEVLIDVVGYLVAGAAGTAGAQGAQGPQGAQGLPGPFPGVLPRGKTLTGVYSATGVASGPNQYADSPISFGFQFASAPTVVTVGIGNTPALAAAAGCPGTAADPKADPGKVCLYEMDRERTAILAGAPLEAGGGPARVSGYAPLTAFGSATKYGTIVEIYSSEAGNFFSNGTWAATSP